MKRADQEYITSLGCWRWVVIGIALIVIHFLIER